MVEVDLRWQKPGTQSIKLPVPSTTSVMTARTYAQYCIGTKESVWALHVRLALRPATM